MILQIAAFAVAIAFGVFAVKSIDIARTANKYSASANSYAARALEEARVANQVAMLAVCSQSGDVQVCAFLYVVVVIIHQLIYSTLFGGECRIVALQPSFFVFLMVLRWSCPMLPAIFSPKYLRLPHPRRADHLAHPEHEIPLLSKLRLPPLMLTSLFSCQRLVHPSRAKSQVG